MNFSNKKKNLDFISDLYQKKILFVPTVKLIKKNNWFLGTKKLTIKKF